MKLSLPFYTNALFSSACALLMLLLPAQVGGWLGWRHDGLFVALGVALLGFAGALCWIAAQLPGRRKWAGLATAADAGWVLGTPLVLVLFGELFSAAGVVLLWLVAAAVAALGAAQWWVMRGQPA
mgnify:CR=1 FL=1